MQGPTDNTSAIKPTAAPPTSKPGVTTPVDPLHDLIPGYPMLAGHMGNMSEVAMFRRFGALNARNLLYYQNELVCLEEELKVLEAEDAKSKSGKKARYVTVHGVGTSRVPRALSWRSSLHSMSTFWTRVHHRYVM
jgi:hypothetical protein